MAGIADMLFGGGAQAYSVPDPNASMADILAGGVSNAAPAVAGGSVATAYGDSPAPGAVASAGAQANAAAGQEPGILDKARNWATTNPVQAQALMQGFAALASGRTRGGFVQQMGQFAGVANQTMVEQNAANAAQAREQQTKDRDFGLRSREADSNIAYRQNADRRADALLPGQLEAQDNAAERSEEGVLTSRQQRGQSEQLFTPKMQQVKLQLDKLRNDIALAPTERAAAQLRLKASKLEYDIHSKFAIPEAEAILGIKAQQLSNAQEEGTGKVLANDAAIKKQKAIDDMPEAERNYYYRNGKPKEAPPAKTRAQIANDLLEKEPDAYRDNKTGAILYDRLGSAVDAVVNGGERPAATQEAWASARNSVKPGQKYIGPDGAEYTRGK